MPRFVVLEHDGPRGLHWDFMLETGEVLATWALPQPPDAGSDLSAESLPDHRPAYLDYEGPVSGDRGSVVQWDSGTYELRRRSGSGWTVSLQGKRLRGTAIVMQSHGPTSWRFAFQPEATDDAGQ